MTQTAEIILWSVSLSLATLGITFGIIASRNAKQANKNIQDQIINSIIVEETQKLFFDGLKVVITQSKKAIKMLKSKDITFYDYSIISANSRMYPISKRIFKAFDTTEYKDITKLYVENKNYIDDEYIKILGDFSVLKTEKKVTAEVKNKLIDYHNHLIDSAATIIKLYTTLTQPTTLKLK